MTLGVRDRRPSPAPGAPGRRSRRAGWSARSLIFVVNGVVASVGAVYLVTGSIPAAVIGAAFGVALAGWLAIVGR